METLSTSVFEIIDRSQLTSKVGLACPDSTNCDCAGAPNGLVLATDCDCACATPASPPQTIPNNFKNFTQQLFCCVPELRLAPLADGYWTAFNPAGQFGVMVLNQAAYELLNHFWQPISLDNLLPRVGEDIGAVVARLVALELLQKPGQTPSPLPNQARVLIAWLHLTNQCNLRCTYCYINKTNDEMSESTGRAAVEAVVRSAVNQGYTAIKLKYAGGEAALNMTGVFNLHDYALSLCQAHHLKLEAVLLSNGTSFTPAKIAGLKARQIKVMVSLDGLDQVHDRQRPYLGGQGSARQVVAGIEQLMAHGLPPHLSITITAHNCDQIEAVVSFALERNLTFNLNFYRENVYSSHLADLRYSEANLIAGVKAAYRAIEANLPAWSVIGSVLDLGQLISPHPHPCSAGRDYLVIDHQGRIAKCHMELNQPVTNVQHPDPLSIIRLSPVGLQNPAVREKEGCSICEWRYGCAGGCPIVAYRATGRYQAKSPNCNIYKTIYPEAVRLEGLRLLKFKPHSGDTCASWQ